MIDLLLGVVGSPRVIGLARGIAEGVVFLVIYSVADFMATLPDFSMLVPLMWVAIRTVEGHIDGIDPVVSRKRAAAPQ